MKVEQFAWDRQSGWSKDFPGNLAESAQLVLVFGATAALNETELVAQIRRVYPCGYVLGCSTAGEIRGTHVLDDSVVVTAVHFDHTNLAAAEIEFSDAADSLDAGRRLARCLDPVGLVHVLVISDGLKVNGSELVKGLTSHLSPGVSVSGGLSGDGARFAHTLVCSGPAAREGKVAVIGFYGSRLRVGCGSMGGWDSFGPDRLVTRSRANVLYELDGQSALALYKKYLGEHAARLPASGLLFPLSIRGEGSDAGKDGLVRTILSVNESEQSMTFAGDIAQGTHARLMRASFERLIDGAQGAAQVARRALGDAQPSLAILISCVGRKLVLKQRIEEEVEVVSDVLGPSAVLAGFYSYGEISPFAPTARCELHNQTMTITTFAELAQP
jgi:hypothetical protein